MTDLHDLYQEVILDHGRKPRNFRRIDRPTRSVEGYNPLCGDHFTVDVLVEGDRVKDLSFEGGGCAISTASASMMTQALIGKSVDEAIALFEGFRHLVTGEGDGGEDLGKLNALGSVSKFPMRIKCATLAWHAMRAALKNSEEPVTTE